MEPDLRDSYLPGHYWTQGNRAARIHHLQEFTTLIFNTPTIKTTRVVRALSPPSGAAYLAQKFKPTHEISKPRAKDSHCWDWVRLLGTRRGKSVFICTDLIDSKSVVLQSSPLSPRRIFLCHSRESGSPVQKTLSCEANHPLTHMHKICILVCMRTTLNIDDELLERASQLTGINEKTSLVRLGLEALISRESGRRLADLGGSEPELRLTPRRRSAKRR